MLRIDVAGHHVRLDLVAVQARAGAGVVDGVQDREELAGLVAVAERGERDHGPHRGVRVLPAVLAHARDVSLDVAGLEGRAVEGRREEQDEPVSPPDQVLVDGRHGPPAPLGIGGARDHSPGLRDRVDAALVVGRGSERRPVVEEGAAIPVAVPAVALERELQGVRVLAPGERALRFPALLGQAGELVEVRRGGTSPAIRSRPGRPRRPGSCRRSSRRCPSAAARGGRPRGSDRALGRSARRGTPSRRTLRAGSTDRSPPARAAPPRGTEPARRARRDRR